jgi:hypothetical protein
LAQTAQVTFRPGDPDITQIGFFSEVHWRSYVPEPPTLASENTLLRNMQDDFTGEPEP